MIHAQQLTEEQAALERARILEDVHFHRREAKRRLRDLQRLEAICSHLGIRLVREPVRPVTGENHASADPDHR